MNLIICCTPLQVLIAEKIIARFPEQQFYGVMLSTVSNEKFDYYRQRLAQKCTKLFSMVQKIERLQLLKQIIYLKSKFYGKHFDRVFVANINELQIQFILSSVRFNQLNTFDDGTANIIPNSIFYVDNSQSKIRKAINTILGNRYSLEKLKNLSFQHYTIYPNQPNIIDNTVVIDLVDNQQSTSYLDETEVVSILLGQAIYCDDHKNVLLAEKIIKQFDIQLYLPHPREKYYLENVEYIKTPLIFEDYILQVSKYKRYRIYTYFSSAVLNIFNKSSNIEVISLRAEVSEPAYIKSYELLAKIGVNMIDIRE